MLQPSLTHYTIPAPTRNIIFWALALATSIGVVALGLAAYSAFAVVNNPIEAGFKALLIEISAIAEALALARAKRRRDYIVPVFGMLIAVVVSGTYNYTQAASSTGGKALSTWELYALAIGPLAAVTMLALGLSKTIRDHDAALGQWHTDRQTWYAAELDKFTAQEDERRKTEDDRRRTEAAAAEAAATAERLRLEQIARDERATAAQLRIENKRMKQTFEIEKLKLSGQSTGQNASPVNGPVNPTEQAWTLPQLREWLKTSNGNTPRSASELEKLTQAPHSTAQRWFKTEVAPLLTAHQEN